jgi:DNA-binding response OmpR family regulator
LVRYLTKPFALAELLARVRALVRRGFHKGGAKLCYADLELDRHRRRATRGKEAILLTSKEFALLELFLLRAPEPITRSEIIAHIWNYHFESETNIVEVYINRLRQKIDQNRPAKLIHTVRGVGYQLVMLE